VTSTGTVSTMLDALIATVNANLPPNLDPACLANLFAEDCVNIQPLRELPGAPVGGRSLNMGITTSATKMAGGAGSRSSVTLAFHWPGGGTMAQKETADRVHRHRERGGTNETLRQERG